MGSPEALSALPEAPEPSEEKAPTTEEEKAKQNVDPLTVKQEADRTLPGQPTPSES